MSDTVPSGTVPTSAEGTTVREPDETCFVSYRPCAGTQTQRRDKTSLMMRMWHHHVILITGLLTLGCIDTTNVVPTSSGDTELRDSTLQTDAGKPDALLADTTATDITVLVPIEAHVSLDGEPAPATVVSQGGNPERWTTNAEGIAWVTLDLSGPGEMVLIASHPDARIRGKLVSPDHTGPVELTLTRFDTTDNPDYLFKDPGEPGESHLIEKCGHCHLTMDDTWFESAHKTSASNPVLQDIYQGTASGFTNEAACSLAGGT